MNKYDTELTITAIMFIFFGAMAFLVDRNKIPKETKTPKVFEGKREPKRVDLTLPPSSLYLVYIKGQEFYHKDDQGKETLLVKDGKAVCQNPQIVK